MSKDSELIDLSIGYNVLTGSNCSILLHYNKMINKARVNIGKRTTNGVLININFINKLSLFFINFPLVKARINTLNLCDNFLGT